MQRILFLFLLLFVSHAGIAQKANAYFDSVKAYREYYVISHEVVKRKDRKYFRFFPVNNTYRVNCYFEKINDTIGFAMRTSAGTLKYYYKYGKVRFSLSGTICELYVYQAKDLMKTEKYRDYLFIPFTDSTTGDESYGSGRYLDLSIPEITGNRLFVDFNKAYNPYCAYAKGFHCPIPPRENNLPVAVRAGERNFAKKH